MTTAWKDGGTARIVLCPCDGGQHGISLCEACGETLPDELPHECPGCGRTLEGTTVSPSAGGSDF
jgi:hypothetical protein